MNIAFDSYGSYTFHNYKRLFGFLFDHFKMQLFQKNSTILYKSKVFITLIEAA